MADDWAIVNQKEIGDAAQTLAGFLFVGADRFVSQIAARRDDGKI